MVYQGTILMKDCPLPIYRSMILTFVPRAETFYVAGVLCPLDFYQKSVCALYISWPLYHGIPVLQDPVGAGVNFKYDSQSRLYRSSIHGSLRFSTIYIFGVLGSDYYCMIPSVPPRGDRYMHSARIRINFWKGVQYYPLILDYYGINAWDDDLKKLKMFNIKIKICALLVYIYGF